jgi:hypothetical protein
MDKHDLSASYANGLNCNSKLIVAGLQLVKGKLAIVTGLLQRNFLARLQHRDLRFRDAVTGRKENHSTNAAKRLERRHLYTSGCGELGAGEEKCSQK